MPDRDPERAAQPAHDPRVGRALHDYTQETRNLMTDDIHTPEILATVGHFDYIIGVLKRPRDGGAAHF
jgi:hypothetical protein